jgi:hypothetical protein
VRRSAKRGELAGTRAAKPATSATAKAVKGAKPKPAGKAAKAAKPKATAAKASAAKPAGSKAKGAKAAKSKSKPKAASNGSGPLREPRRTPRPKPATVTAGAKVATAEPRATPRPAPAAAETRSAAAAAQAPPGDPSFADATHAGTPPPPPKRKVPAAGYAAPSPRDEVTENAVADLVTTTVQAAQELAQIGIDVGRAAVRSMLDRLPRG